MGRTAANDTSLARRLAISADTIRRPARAHLDWLADRCRRRPFVVTEVPFARLDGWGFAPEADHLVHRTGRFFSIEGIHVRTDYGPTREWSQPIIKQPEGAIMGIIVKEIDGVLCFLMQSKMEPGNLTVAQISPTVQATPSNYLRVHSGGSSRYLEYFTDPGLSTVHFDVLQSEQGSWFRGKRNRNIVVEVTGEIEPHEDFAWLTLGEIFELLYCPNIVNMDARSTLSCLPLPAPAACDPFREAVRRSVAGGPPLHPMGEVRRWFNNRKVAYQAEVTPVPLSSMAGWHRTDTEIHHEQRKFFRVIGIRAQASNREVASWCQPLLAPKGVGLTALFVRSIGGVAHVLVRLDVRPGYRDVAEIGPTVQCTPGNYRDVPGRQRPAFLDLLLSEAVRVRYDIQQSEEGGRFQRALTRHVIAELPDDFPLALPPDFAWLTVAQLKELARESYQVNVEARSLALCLHSLSRRP
jgi:oxidase EvaA